MEQISLHNVGDVAKEIGLGRTKLFKKLRDDGFLTTKNMPYQRYIDAGYFVVIPQEAVIRCRGKSFTNISYKSVLTDAGRNYILKKYGQEISFEQS